MRALIIIAVIVAVIALLLLIPIKCSVYFRYNNELEHSLDLYYGFIKIRLPQPKEKTERSNPEQTNEQPPEPEKKKSKIGAGEIIAFARENADRIKRLIFSVLGYIFKKAVKINKLKIRLVMGVDDAMETALIFGAASAFIFNLAGTMDKHMRLGKHSINLKPAFNNPHIFTEDEAVISTSIFNILAIAAIAVRHAAPLYMKFRRVMKNGKSD